MNILLIILINLTSAMLIPRPCIYLYFYDKGEKDTYCMLIKETDSYLNHGDTTDDRMAVLDCSQGILDKGERISKTQPILINTISSKCLEPQNWQLKIIKELYKNNIKVYPKFADK